MDQLQDDYFHDSDRIGEDYWSFTIDDDDDDEADLSHGDDNGNETRRPPLNDDLSLNVPEPSKQLFQTDGFVVFPNVLSPEMVDALNQALEHILRGHYDRDGKPPDKAPKRVKLPMPSTTASASSLETPETTPTQQQKQQKQPPNIHPLGFSGNHQNVKVLQVINCHKCNTLFRRVATHPRLGRVVAQLAGWDQDCATERGTRLAQDQVWAKPPSASALTFHRDSPYFFCFTTTSPTALSEHERNDEEQQQQQQQLPQVVTVWLALDDMDEELGPLQYVKGSHLWDDGEPTTTKDHQNGRNQQYGNDTTTEDTTASASAAATANATTAASVGQHHHSGSANQFFDNRHGGLSLVKAAARRQGILRDHEKDNDCENENVNSTQLDIVSLAGLRAGGIAIHHGKTWHGSGPNRSRNRPRRGLGLHFVPAHVNALLTREAAKSRLWRQYVDQEWKNQPDIDTTMELPLDDFPITWAPTS